MTRKNIQRITNIKKTKTKKKKTIDFVITS